MPGFLQRVHGIAVFGGVVCALAANVPVGAQEAMTAVPQIRNAAAVSPSDSSKAWPSHEATFTAFVQEIGGDDLAARKETITGEKQGRVDWARLNHVSIGLTDEEWASAYAILLEGSDQLGAWSDRMQESLGWRDGRFEGGGSARATEHATGFDALSDQRNTIINDTMTKLEQKLGGDAFNRLDAFVYRREGGERVIDRSPMRRGRTETAALTIQSAVPEQK
ncbi:MAG TPA: hypothetical protein VHZ25_04070 [Acidobacteriaceae bacterium]|jgi:hypothetical protein|nr:hypothetical protein [Acidobacteriaceae bacterium]